MDRFMDTLDTRVNVKRNKEKLADAISPKFVSVVHELFIRSVIGRPMMEKLYDNDKPHPEKARDLLELIVSLESDASDYLYDVVVEAQLYQAADILSPICAPHERYMRAKPQPQTEEYDSTDETEEDDSPEETMEYGTPYEAMDSDSSDETPSDSWPSAEDIKAYNTARLVDVKHTRMINKFKRMLTPKGQESKYLMSAKPRGQVLIINNEQFTHLTGRYGSREDRKSLEKLFNSLDFDVKVEENKTKEEMWKLLEEESRRDYHNTAQCFVLFILSYGHTGVVFGTDGHMMNGHPVNCLDIEDITELFSRSKALLGKPKLFFILACQGDAKNEGHPVGHAQADDSNSTVSRQPASDCIPLSDEQVIEQEKLIYEAKNRLDEMHFKTQAKFAWGKRPSGPDVFTALATTPDFILYRNEEIGTWFIQAICYVFAKYAYKYELSKLMTLVVRFVRRAETGKGRSKQACINMSTFYNDLYFFPGLFDEK